MIPRPITPQDIEDFPGHCVVTMHAPVGLEDEVASVDVLVSEDGVTMVPFAPDEIDIATLARGGTVWVVVKGSMPPMYVAVGAAR